MKTVPYTVTFCRIGKLTEIIGRLDRHGHQFYFRARDGHWDIKVSADPTDADILGWIVSSVVIAEGDYTEDFTVVAVERLIDEQLGFLSAPTSTPAMSGGT